MQQTRFFDLPPYPQGATGALALLGVIVLAFLIQRIVFAIALRAVSSAVIAPLRRG